MLVVVQERLQKAAEQKTALEDEVRKVSARLQEMESSSSSCELARRNAENDLQKTVAELTGKESQILVNDARCRLSCNQSYLYITKRPVLSFPYAANSVISKCFPP